MVPVGELTALPQNLNLDLKGVVLRGGERRGQEGMGGKERIREGREGECKAGEEKRREGEGQGRAIE